jgi:predicted enzyme related to lactoylglutathione lyase
MLANPEIRPCRADILHPMASKELLYLYMGSDDVGRDLDFYRDHLGAELIWRREGAGTEVAAVRLGEGPLVLIAEHRAAPSARQIWEVDDLDAARKDLESAGELAFDQAELPEGPCLLVTDPSGNELGLLQRTRPGVMGSGEGE